MSSGNRVTIVSEGLDWLTFTGPQLDERAYTYGGEKNSYEIVRELMLELFSSDYPQREWSTNQYYGISCGNVQIGQNDRLRREMFAMSGDDTEKMAFALVEHIPPLRCTRIDHQVTVRLSEPNPNLAMVEHSFYQGFVDLKKQSGYKKPMPKPMYIQSPTGATLYIGRRSTDRVIRIYDKSSSYDAPLGTYWRYEVELKRRLSEGEYASWWHSVEHKRHSRAVVARELETVGITIPNLSTAGYEPKRAYNLAKNSHLSSMDWLARVVTPCVQRLIQAGYANEVHAILGLELSQLDEGE